MRVPVARGKAADLAEVGVKAGAVAKIALGNGRGRHAHANPDDELRKPQRRRDEDEHAGDEELPRPPSARLPLGLGVASLSLAVLVLLTVWISALDAVILPMCVLCLVLGLAGLIVAIAKGVGHVFPIAGCEVGGIALFVSLIWVVIIPGITRGVREVTRELARGGAVDREGVPAKIGAPVQTAQTDLQARKGDRVRVGDWVEYRQSSTLAKTVITLKKTVKAVNNNSITLRTEMTVDGKATPGVDLDLPRAWLSDPLMNDALTGNIRGVFNQVEKGQETLAVGDVKVACDWTSSTSSATIGRTRLETTIKIWVSHAVPLDGMVREEIIGANIKTTLELVRFGIASD